MARASVAVRDATPDDLPDLLAMWQELRALTARGERVLPAATAEGVLARLATARADPQVRVLVATIDAEVVGMGVLTLQPVAALVEGTTAHLHYLHVRAGRRRHGAGQALVAAAVAFAEDHGAEHLATDVGPHLREANRFFARLGFGPLAVRRVASVAVLRRRLPVDGRLSMVDGEGRRRSVRARVRAPRLRTALSPAGD